jgi:hypothetical protein
LVVAVRASSAAGLGTSPERFIDDGLDGTRTAAALGAAAETVIDLLGTTRQVVRIGDRVADIVVAEDVTGTNNHGNRETFTNLTPSILKRATGCKRKNRLLK